MNPLNGKPLGPRRKKARRPVPASTGIERMTELPGATYKVVVETPERRYRVYITINEQDGAPFEVFVRCDNPQLYEWITALTLLTSKLLQRGVSLKEIGQELQIIHSGATSSHFLPGGQRCLSMVARIGQILERHADCSPLGRP